MKKIFIVEDNEQASKLIKKAIEVSFKNFIVLSYNSVEIALRNISEKPDYIILDHFLDKIDGIDSIPVFKEFLPDAKIIIVSSQNNIQSFENAFLYGASDYVRKDALYIINIIEYLKKDAEKINADWYNSVISFFKIDPIKKKIKFIYILDDNLSTSYFTRHILQMESFDNVLLFGDTDNFINQVALKKPEVAILEFSLEQRTKEVELVKHLKALSPETEVLIFSDQTNVKVAAELLRSGASHYIVKSQKNLLRLKTILK